jgi:hypothetical protein
MIKKILLLLLFLTILACSSKPEKPIPEKQHEGWAGNPDNPNEKPFDYFYMKSFGRGSLKSIGKKNGDMMKATCMQSAFIEGKSDLIRKILDSLGLENISETKVMYSFSSETYENIGAKFHLIRASDTGCRISPKLIKEYMSKIKEVKINDCNPLYPDDPEIPGSGWKECQCILYLHSPGARDAILARDQELGCE